MGRLLLLMVLLLGGLNSLSGQIRVIPQGLRDSVANPHIVPSTVRLLPTSECHLGTIPEAGGVVTREVRWTNGGETTPVVITGIKTSCGCLRAEYSQEPLKRGEEGWIRLHYNPKGHPGAIGQRLFIYTSLSASRPTAILSVVGQVTPAADPQGRYPYQAAGPLYLRQETIRLQGEQEVRVACLNSGRRAIRVVEDPLLTPRGVRVMTDPEVLAPSAEGDLVIRVEEPSRFKDLSPLPLFLEGFGEELPPRKRTILLLPE